MNKDAFNKIWGNIKKGQAAYYEEVEKMTDTELYEHVYDEEYDEEDFASKEAVKRGITKDGYQCSNCQNGCPVCGGSGFIVP